MNVTTKEPPMIIVMMEGAIWIARCSQMTHSPGYRRPIRGTMAGDLFEVYGQGLCDPGKLEAEIVGPVEMHELKGSNGWTRLVELGISKSVDQQVKSALASFSSESGSARLQIKDFVSSALSSLQDDVKNASIALKKQKKRAKKYLSATAHGLVGKPKKSPLLTAIERSEAELTRRIMARAGVKKPAKRKMPAATRARLDRKKRRK